MLCRSGTLASQWYLVQWHQLLLRALDEGDLCGNWSKTVQVVAVFARLLPVLQQDSMPRQLAFIPALFVSVCMSSSSSTSDELSWMQSAVVTMMHLVTYTAKVVNPAFKPPTVSAFQDSL